MATTTPRKKVAQVSAALAKKTAPKVIAKTSPKKPLSDRSTAVAPTAKSAPIKKSTVIKTPVPAQAAAPKPKARKVKAAPTAQAVASPTIKTRPADKVKKPKLVRDSFTMPEAEYAALGEVKKACLKAGFEVKKSELLRIGVALVRKMALAVLKQEVGALTPLKPGRPPEPN